MQPGGKLIIICAPSGSGKTSVLQGVLPELPELEFSVSACSRSPREGEEHGKHYYFFSPAQFKEKIEKDEFIEWEEVYEGNYYGTLHAEIKRIWDKGKHVVLDLDVLGGVNMRSKFPDHSIAIFIRPPSLKELERRLAGRGTENPESLKKRLNRAEYELSFANRFDVQIVNDQLTHAIAQTKEAIKTFLHAK